MNSIALINGSENVFSSSIVGNTSVQNWYNRFFKCLIEVTSEARLHPGLSLPETFNYEFHFFKNCARAAPAPGGSG